MIDRLTSGVWRLSYDLETARARYSDRRQLWRQAAVCVGLALIRFAGARI